LRNPVIVLENLQSKTEDDTYTFKRLFRNLYNPDVYLLAYSNIYSTEGNMTKGCDGNTIDGMSLARIKGIIEKIKSHTYKPNPAIRKYILKKNGKKRPLGIQATDGKLVQEVIRMILESIYDYNFKNTSHGFRPNKSCHTALKSIQLRFTGVKWFVEGDISAYLDNIDHHTLINILRRRIKDEYFIAVIWRFLKAGYIDGDDKITALKYYGTIVCTEVKKNMIIPEACDEKGRLTCPEGHLAIFEEFDKEALIVTYSGDTSYCPTCFRHGTCAKEFNYSFEKEPQFFGPIGQCSELQERMLRFRKQSELNFALEANLLDNVLHHKKLTVRGIKRAEIFLKMADIFRLVKGMLQHAEEFFVPTGRATLLRKLAEQAIYDRTILNIA